MRITVECPLVLGSASPRRRDLLDLAGIPFLVRPSPIDETELEGEDANAYLERVAAAKLEAVRRASADAGRPPEPILVADTVVVAPGEKGAAQRALLGKPKDESEALGMILRLSGRSHEVRTRFVLATSVSDAPAVHAQTVATAVTFRALSPGEALAYARTGEGQDKAGGYAVQGLASLFVERIEGSYANVVGLPICDVIVALRAIAWFPGP